MVAESTRVFGAAVTGALLGLDALYRSESGDPDGLVVVNLDAEGRHEADGFGSYLEARSRWVDLQAESLALPEADRRVYYGELCRSSLAFISWREEGLSFPEQLSGFLHVPAAPAAEAELDALRAEMRSLLSAMGYTGDLAGQCAAWEERNRVPATDAPGVLAGLLDEAWTRTEERLLEIPASRDDGLRVEAVRGVPYNARCDYLSRRLQLNVEPTLTLPGLRHLAVHEGYPGHYVQFKLRETLARSGETPSDVVLSVVNTASSCVFEGIADAGLEMIGWLETNDDRLHSLLNRHRAGIGTVAAWRLHGRGEPAAEVRDWLRGAALVGGDGWVANRMAFLGAPARAALIWSYWWGERSVAPVWRRLHQARRPDFLRFLHGRMHSVNSVEMFH